MDEQPRHARTLPRMNTEDAMPWLRESRSTWAVAHHHGVHVTAESASILPPCPPDMIYAKLPGYLKEHNDCSCYSVVFCKQPDLDPSASLSRRPKWWIERLTELPLVETFSYVLNVCLLLLMFIICILYLKQIGTKTIEYERDTWDEEGELPPICIDDRDLIQAGYAIYVRECEMVYNSSAPIDAPSRDVFPATCTPLTSQIANSPVATTTMTREMPCLPSGLEVKGNYGDERYKYIEMRVVAPTNQTVSDSWLNLYIDDHKNSIKRSQFNSHYYTFGDYAEQNIEQEFKKAIEHRYDALGRKYEKTTYLTWSDERTRSQRFHDPDCDYSEEDSLDVGGYNWAECDGVALNIYFKSALQLENVHFRTYSLVDWASQVGGFFTAIFSAFLSFMLLFAMTSYYVGIKQTREGALLEKFLPCFRSGNGGITKADAESGGTAASAGGAMELESVKHEPTAV